MSNRKLPRSPVERGIFCSLFPVSCVCPVLAGIPAILLSVFLSIFLSIYFSVHFSGIVCRHLLYVHSAGLYPASSVLYPASSVWYPYFVYCAGIEFRHFRRLLRRMSSGIFPSSSLSFLLFTCGAILFLGCLSAIFYIFLYFSIFFYIFICIYQKIVVPLHRLSEWTDMTYCIFAFAIYWTFRNVGNF